MEEECYNFDEKMTNMVRFFIRTNEIRPDRVDPLSIAFADRFNAKVQLLMDKKSDDIEKLIKLQVIQDAFPLKVVQILLGNR